MTGMDLQTSTEGIFAAGDVRAGSTKQSVSAAGEDAAAALAIREHLRGHDARVIESALVGAPNFLPHSLPICNFSIHLIITTLCYSTSNSGFVWNAYAQERSGAIIFIGGGEPQDHELLLEMMQDWKGINQYESKRASP